MQHWAADRETMLDAKLAGMKAGLGLTTDQEKLWGPFESAVKDADKSRMDAMGQMMRMRAQGERMSPIDHLEAMADRLSQGATNVKKIADAAKPLYDSPRRVAEAQVWHAWTHADAGAVPVRHGHDAPSHGRTRPRRRRVVPGRSIALGEKKTRPPPRPRLPFSGRAPHGADQPALGPNGHDAIDAGKILVGPDVGKATLIRDCSHVGRLADAKFGEQPTARSK